MIPTGQFPPRKLPPKKIPPLRITPTWTIPTWTIPTQKIPTQDNFHLHNSHPGQFLPGKFLPRKISIQLISTLDNCSPPNLTKFNNIYAIPQNFSQFFSLNVIRDEGFKADHLAYVEPRWYGSRISADCHQKLLFTKLVGDFY